MAERRVKVTTEVGIQARPATVFVETAAESDEEVSLAKAGHEPVDAKSILQVLTLDVRSGEEVVVESADESILERLAALVTGADPRIENADVEIVDSADPDEE